jgi:small conductance mechanosensitive channel
LNSNPEQLALTTSEQLARYLSGLVRSNWELWPDRVLLILATVAVAIVVYRLADWVHDRLADRLLRTDLPEVAPTGSRRLISLLLALLFGILRFVVFAGAVAFLMMLAFEADWAQTFVARSLGAVLAVGLAALLLRLIKPISEWVKPLLLRRAETTPGETTLRYRGAVNALSLLGSTVRWIIIALAGLYVLASYGVNLWPVLTGVGFLGAAIAFGSQTLVRDLVTGLFIMLEGQYAVGEWVSLSGQFGRVAEISFRTTVLETAEGRRLYLPNGSIGNVQVYPGGRVDYEVKVPLQEDGSAEDVRDLLAGLTTALYEAFPTCLLDFGAPSAYRGGSQISGVRQRLTVCAGEDWLITEELLPRLQGRLAEAGITMPAGMAPAARLRGPGV